ncbi:hypothetical protein CROQUDRAFT_249643 [Cronartium quercuum f. sp. fusiforme G11]|uniref:Uncharacterized protein n=1 Tax=Cronartium quercuum f. sp. fusiforme G11 TaxID=708437 RepID=A0A9P6N910_9BASI|nr:hypothetical protein CROQUDRAFT_249643 [Cronartium quercuum f. sp. fusiforme G11]
MYHMWRRKLRTLATAVLCATYTLNSRAYMIATTLSDLSLNSHPKDTLFDAHLIDHALFPHSSNHLTHPLEIGLLVEGILRRNTYQLNLNSRQVSSAYANRTIDPVRDQLEHQLFIVFGQTIKYGWTEPTFVEGIHDGWSKVAALGPFNSQKTYSRLVNVCRWYEQHIGSSELQRRSRLLTILDARGNNNPIWWKKEDMHMFIARKMNWEYIIKIGDAIKIWEPSNINWTPIDVTRIRRLLLVLLYLRSASHRSVIPWQFSEESLWLEKFLPSHTLEPPPHSTSHRTEPSLKPWRFSVYTYRVKLLLSDIKSSFQHPWSIEQLEKGSWITEGLRLEFSLKGLDLNVMIHIRLALEVALEPHASSKTLNEAAQLLLKSLKFDNGSRVSVRRWFDDVMGPGTFEHRLQLTMQRLRLQKVVHYHGQTLLTRWKEQCASIYKRVEAHDSPPD